MSNTLIVKPISCEVSIDGFKPHVSFVEIRFKINEIPTIILGVDPKHSGSDGSNKNASNTRTIKDLIDTDVYKQGVSARDKGTPNCSVDLTLETHNVSTGNTYTQNLNASNWICEDVGFLNNTVMASGGNYCIVFTLRHPAIQLVKSYGPLPNHINTVVNYLPTGKTFADKYSDYLSKYIKGMKPGDAQLEIETYTALKTKYDDLVTLFPNYIVWDTSDSNTRLNLPEKIKNLSFRGIGGFITSGSGNIYKGLLDALDSYLLKLTIDQSDINGPLVISPDSPWADAETYFYETMVASLQISPRSQSNIVGVIAKTTGKDRCYLTATETSRNCGIIYPTSLNTIKQGNIIDTSIPSWLRNTKEDSANGGNGGKGANSATITTVMGPSIDEDVDVFQIPGYASNVADELLATNVYVRALLQTLHKKDRFCSFTTTCIFKFIKNDTNTNKFFRPGSVIKLVGKDGVDILYFYCESIVHTINFNTAQCNSTWMGNYVRRKDEKSNIPICNNGRPNVLWSTI